MNYFLSITIQCNNQSGIIFEKPEFFTKVIPSLRDYDDNCTYYLLRKVYNSDCEQSCMKEIYAEIIKILTELKSMSGIFYTDDMNEYFGFCIETLLRNIEWFVTYTYRYDKTCADFMPYNRYNDFEGFSVEFIHM